MPEANEHRPAVEEPFLQMDSTEGRGGLSSTILIVLIIASLLFVGFLVFYKYSLISQAAEKESTLNNLMSELNSPDNEATILKARSIDSAVNIIRTASKTKYSFKGFIDDLKKKITTDVKLNNLSIDETGLVTIDGQSSNYRSVADLAVAIDSSDKIEDVNITSLTMDPNATPVVAVFSITAKISDWGTLNKKAVKNTENTPSDLTGIGGTSE